MPTVRKILRLIDVPESTDTSLSFDSLPPIVKKGTEDLLCGSCGMVIGESVSSRDLYLAAAALLRNRMPSRLILTCGHCQKYNVVPAPLGD
jgi:hypothetical protein